MKILNGFNTKNNVSECIMTKYTYTELINKVKDSWKATAYRYIENDDFTFSQVEVRSPTWIPLNRNIPTHERMLRFRDEFYMTKSYYNHDKGHQHTYWGLKDLSITRHNPDGELQLWANYWTDGQLKDFLGIKDLGKWAMINISPDWKGTITQEMVDHLEWCIKEYYAEGWYGEGYYTIESGGEGNMLHAHCMFRMDTSPKGYKSLVGTGKNRGHLGKGNHYQQLKKYWDKHQGFQGQLKGKYSIQLIRCLSNEMVRDKLSYLIEADKPKGHTNLDVKGIKGINVRKEA